MKEKAQLIYNVLYFNYYNGICHIDYPDIINAIFKNLLPNLKLTAIRIDEEWKDIVFILKDKDEKQYTISISPFNKNIIDDYKNIMQNNLNELVEELYDSILKFEQNYLLIQFYFLASTYHYFLGGKPRSSIVG